MDSSGSVGTWTSIALDSSDNVHISYSDNTNFDLKYATNATGSWVTETVDSSKIVGTFTSIALDSLGNVHISYYDFTPNDDLKPPKPPNDDLKYATNATGSWVTETVDSSGIVGRFTSIVLDSSDNVHISYRDDTNFDLKYATNATDSWVTETVDSSGRVGMWTSIALDTSDDDNVHISYTDETNRDLKYATNATGSWVITTVDSSGSVGFLDTSIVVDTSDNAHISYYDFTNFDLKYATGHPVPDIKVNGSDGPVTPTGNLSVTIALNPGSSSGGADWWLAVSTPFAPPSDWFHFDLSSGWIPGLSFTLQGPLFDLGSIEVLNIFGLPAGTYIFYFAVDTNMNGSLDLGELFFDFVVVNITP